MATSKKIAVVGSGAAGLASIWALHNYSSHNVYLYESSDRLGGHSNTVLFNKHGSQVPVDTGFIVCNSTTYPNFLAFLDTVNVPTMVSEMSFSISRDLGYFEWAGTSFSTIFAQWKNLISPSMWRLLFDIIRFNHFALDLIREPETNNTTLTVGEYLDRHKYSATFKANYLIPMIAAIWSTSPDKCNLGFPAVTLARFMWNHHLLDTLATRPEWLTIPHGSRCYIDAIMANFPRDRVFINTQVKSIVNDKAGQVCIIAQDGEAKIFDHVIVATSGPQALSIISASATALETEILASFHTSLNQVVLHSDTRLMPQNTKTWSSWNYITAGDSSQVCLTYLMNKLQHIPLSRYGPVLATLNPLFPPNPHTVQGIYSYEHPLYTPEAVRAQRMLPKIQGTRGISYAGAWTRYGFHEDAFTSGFMVAVDQLGAKLPFPLVRKDMRSIPAITWQVCVLRWFLQGINFIFCCVAWVFGGCSSSF